MLIYREAIYVYSILSIKGCYYILLLTRNSVVMKKQLMLPHHRTIGRWKFSFLALFTLCMILLSACSMQKTTSSPSNYSSTSLSMPVIDASLKNQGTMQLETFQQWIMLMKQNDA